MNFYKIGSQKNQCQHYFDDLFKEIESKKQDISPRNSDQNGIDIQDNRSSFQQNQPISDYKISNNIISQKRQQQEYLKTIQNQSNFSDNMSDKFKQLFSEDLWSQRQQFNDKLKMPLIQNLSYSEDQFIYQFIKPQTTQQLQSHYEYIPANIQQDMNSILINIPQQKKQSYAKNFWAFINDKCVLRLIQLIKNNRGSYIYLNKIDQFIKYLHSIHRRHLENKGGITTLAKKARQNIKIQVLSQTISIQNLLTDIQNSTRIKEEQRRQYYKKQVPLFVSQFISGSIKKNQKIKKN